MAHSTGIHMDTFNVAEKEAHEMGKRLVKSISGEITYPDQDVFHEENKKFFSYMVKAGKR